MIGDIFKALFWDNAIQALLEALFQAVPFLGWGPIGWLVTQIAVRAGDALFAVIRVTGNIAAIPIINEEHKKAYDRASANLQIIAHDKGIDSPEFQEARLENQKALRDLGMFRKPPV